MGWQIPVTRHKPPEELAAFTMRKGVKFIPEYNQRHFYLVSTPARDAEMIQEQAKIAHSILSASPETKVTIYVPSKTDSLQKKGSMLNQFLKDDPRLRKYLENKRIEFKVGASPKEQWAQDLGEFVRSPKGSVFLYGLDINKKEVERLHARPQGFTEHGLEKLISTLQIPIKFEGGDVTTTRVKGKKVVIAGPQTVSLTKQYYLYEHGYAIKKSEIQDVLKKAFAADDVLLLNHASPSDHPHLVFHIDQAVFFPKDGVAVMLKPELITSKDPELTEVKSALINYRKQLKKKGFKIIELPVPESHIARFKSYTNSIPISKSDGSTQVIVPSFGDRRTEDNIRRIFKKNGFKVRYVRNHTFTFKGNTHCLTGTIARAYKSKPEKRDMLHLVYRKTDRYA
jgi:agmatine/peptidylarginine deiminase